MKLWFWTRVARVGKRIYIAGLKRRLRLIGTAAWTVGGVSTPSNDGVRWCTCGDYHKPPLCY